ncbi:ABC transporter substrate-binding protein [Saccharopolyspora phatthalungensis]|uniref:Putative spermidine/putrescine transport system substrate-binding protein n=1 Tax=Saccharopolyspora phatthalungensis TaxID=664693 RepID=A0A840QJR2_9PSEU|nr:ABC transporter substrate-binding protein [Saccharopolyspora phatthalungensis]MBB5159389.1 putative spermidine/putrescine transport system substrate-binding protein [Saccharopolyspora phatthalungensis]
MDLHTPFGRRGFLRLGAMTTGAVLGGGGVAALLTGCGGGDASSLIYAGYGGSYQNGIKSAMFDPFGKATGIGVKYTADANDVTKLISMATAGRSQNDVADAQGPAFAQLRSNNALEKLDRAVVTRDDVVDASLITDYSIPYYQFSHNIFWNTSLVSGKMNSWADVWDVNRFPGKRGFQQLPWFTLEIALLADGVAMDRLYPLDVDRAFRSLDRIKPHSVFLDNNSLTNAVSTGELVTADLNLSRVQTMQKSGVKLEYIWNQTMVDVEQLVVLRGGAGRDSAMKAVQYSLDPDTQLRIMRTLGYTPTSKAALAQIPTEDAKNLPGTAETVGQSFYLNSSWWAENYRTVSTRFSSWLTS